MKKRLIFASAMAIATVTSMVFSIIMTNGIKESKAHSAQLHIYYDECIPQNYVDEDDVGDGEDEKWYELTEDGYCTHIPHNSSGMTQIVFYVSPTSEDGLTSWNDITDPETREHVKNTFLASIEKWNNVHFYVNSTSSVVTKKRIAFIYEGSSANHNLVIYPDTNVGFADCDHTSSYQYVDFYNGVSHYHYSDWKIRLNINEVDDGDDLDEHMLNRTGAHELGHVLGLRDIDRIENTSNPNYHHEELLMGYAKNNDGLSRQSEITYKDLVGAAITRGYHTDSDHSWMYDSSSSTSGHYKLICSICNGVKYVSSLTGYSYVNYKTCLDNHSLSSGNMFAVASYGNTDYYKCKYCRYVAPYEDNVIQNYSRTYYDSSYHLVTSQVTGLSYSFYEGHTLNSYDICIGCGHNFHNHTYLDHYATYDSENHKAYCSCGVYTLRPHAVDMDDLHIIHGQTYGNCIQCGELINLSNGGPVINPGPHNTDFMVTDNGSFILPNGIYMLVSEDIEAYLNGTLIFHPYGEVSE